MDDNLPGSQNRGEQPELEAALSAVERLAEQPIQGHVTSFETVHRLLQDELTQADDG